MLTVQNLLFYFSLIGVVTSESYFVKTSYDFRTSEALIFESCKKDYKSIIINVHSNDIDPIFLQQLHQQFNSVLLHTKIIDYRTRMTYQPKVDALLIITTSLRSLGMAAMKIHSTVWWNVMIPVYILNVKDDNCDIAPKILKKVWNINTLIPNYLCIDTNNDIQVYTYNPFTSRASSSWIEMDRTKNITIYRREYNPRTICQELDFDRTKHLNGSKTIIGVLVTEKSISLKGQYINFNEIQKNSSLISKWDYEILHALTITLNITLRLHLLNLIRDNENKFTSQEFHLATDKISANLILTKGDIKLSRERDPNKKTFPFAWQPICNHLNDCLLMRVGSYVQTYPLAWKTIGIATYTRGYKTIGEKVWDFYGIWTVLFTIFVLLITFAVIRFSERRNTAFAVFETIRLLISHNLHTCMNTLPLRIFFITVLIYFLIIQATFNGHLAEFLTKPELRKQIETKGDLKELGYATNRTYYSKNVSEHLAQTDAEKKISVFQARRCLEYVLVNDSSAACVLDHASLLYYGKRNKNLYVSKKPLGEQYSVFWIRYNWPLMKRTNFFFILLEDLGFRQLWSDNDPIYDSIHHSNVVEARSDEDFHPIKLENLMFSFWILAFGLMSASVSFCIEIIISRKSKWTVISNMGNEKRRTLKGVTKNDRQLIRRFLVFIRNK